MVNRGGGIFTFACSYDLARAEGTKAADALTVVSVDTQKKEVRLVRVGSNITMDFVDKTYFKFSY